MELLDVLAQAMKLETDGKEFYLNMVELVQDPDGKAMFSQLAKDVVDHFHYLQRQMDALNAGGGWSSIPDMDSVEIIDAVTVVFPPEKQALLELPSNPSEEDALLFALGVEDKSFKLYYNSAQSAKEPAAKRLFQQLAGAEQVNVQVLMQRYDSRFGYPR